MQFSYKAKNLKGEEKTGMLEAQDKRHLSRLLHEEGYFLLSIGGETGTPNKKMKLPSFNFLSNLFGVSLTEKLFFTRNIRIMIKTAVPLVRATEILALQAKSKKFKNALLQISERISKGENFSSALSAFPRIFSSLYQETVRVGEETGNLEDALRTLNLQMEKESNLKSKIKSAMVYPLMVCGATFIIGILMMIFAVPKLKESFVELEVELPFTTKVVLWFADFLSKKWPLAILILIGLIVCFSVLLKSKKGGRIKSGLILKIPIFSSLARETNSALTLRTLSSLLKAGVPIVHSLQITAGALGNFYFKQSLKEAAEAVEKGEKLSQALKPYEKIYSPMVLQMMEIGEETGETPEVLEKLAEFFEEEVSNATQRMSSIIEPVLILFIGGIVGFFAVSMMQPMFSIMGGIK